MEAPKTIKPDEIADAVTAEVDRVQRVSAAVRDKASRQAGEYVRAYDSRMRDVARHAPAPVDETVSRYPWAVISGALVVGLLVGFVMGSAFTALVNVVTTGASRRQRQSAARVEEAEPAI